jgi:lipid-A-disaccharide synthase
LSESLSSLLSHLSLYKKIARSLLRIKPKTFVAVAYPGVNVLLCRIAKRHGMKVYYMLPPQIWAWGGFRRIFLKRWVDAVISFFPFEADLYRRLGFCTIETDNPLVNSLRNYTRRDRRKMIGFMPGSRMSHVARNMPVVLHLATFIRKRRPDIDLCLIAHDQRHAQELAAGQNALRVVHEDRYQTMKDCDLLLVSSGTASLEAAAMEIPQIFFHKLSFLDDHVLRRFVKVREFNLANLYYGKDVVPCYITSNRIRLRRSLRDAVLRYL